WGDAPEITIQRLAERLQIPVVFGFPAGHQNDNRAFYMGVKSELIVKEGKAELRTYDSSY
ncbi:MAG TPA: LD-carboxypeptidase, partial [Flavobacteriales bacterium]